MLDRNRATSQQNCSSGIETKSRQNLQFFT